MKRLRTLYHMVKRNIPLDELAGLLDLQQQNGAFGKGVLVCVFLYVVWFGLVRATVRQCSRRDPLRGAGVLARWGGKIVQVVQRRVPTLSV